jgi:Tol biopolymer transport system component
VIGRDGSGLRQIVAMRRIGSVAWSPDGAQIAFAAGCQSETPECTGNPAHDVWTVSADGSGLRRITDDVADDTTPAWLPGSG